LFDLLPSQISEEAKYNHRIVVEFQIFLSIKGELIEKVLSNWILNLDFINCFFKTLYKL